MAIKVSTGLANELTDRSSLRQNLNNGRLLLFSGTQPTNADSASNGTLLDIITESAGTFTGETKPVWKVVLAGAAGSVDTISIGGISILPAPIAFTVDLATTATAVAAAITAGFTALDFTAVGSGADVLIYGPNGSGATLNSMVCAATATTMTATPAGAGAVFTPGVTAVNGLTFSFPAASGSVSKAGTWSGTGVATGTSAWFRYCCDPADAGTSASTSYRRIDGSVTVTGGSGDITLDSISISSGQLVTVTSFTLGASQG